MISVWLILKKYLHLYRVQIKNNWVREAIYRTNFLTSIFVDLVWICTEFALFSVIYSNVQEIAGWTQPQVFFFLGVFFTTDSLYTTFFQRSFWLFSDLVNKGELDILLTKPINPLFLALTRWISITSGFNFLLGSVIILKFAGPAGFAGGIHWLALPFWLVFGLLVQITIRFLFVIWVFWTERGFALSRLYYQFFTLSTKPDSLYPKVIRYLILTVLPFAFISSVPTRALLFGLKKQEYFLLFAVLTTLISLCFIFWRKGMLRYQSASS